MSESIRPIEAAQQMGFEFRDSSPLEVNIDGEVRYLYPIAPRVKTDQEIADDMEWFKRTTADWGPEGRYELAQILGIEVNE